MLPTLDYGGAELQSIQQINQLHQQGFKVHLIVLDAIKHQQLRSTLHIPSIQINELYFTHTTLGQKAIKKIHALIPTISQNIIQQQATHVVAHLPLSHFTMRLVKLYSNLKHRYNFKLICYHHAMQYQASPLNTLTKKIFNQANSLLAYLADNQNICVSKIVCQHLQQHIHLRQPSIIYNSVAHQVPNQQLATQYYQQHHISSKTYTIIIPGRLHPAKGHRFFLQTFRLWVQQQQLHPKQVQVIFAGGGTLQQTLQQQIKQQQLQEYLHITGTITNYLLLSLVNAAQLVVIPSLSEGFGIVAIEALMLGKVIISSNAGGLSEIIQHQQNGYQFPVGNQSILLKQLQQAYDNRNTPILKKINIINSYQQKFTETQQIQQLKKLFS